MIQKPWILSHVLKVFVACWTKALDLFPPPCSVPSFPVLFLFHAWLFVPGLFCSLPSPSLHLSGDLNYRIFPWAHYLNLNHHLVLLPIPAPNFFIHLVFLSSFTLCPWSLVLFSSCPTSPDFLSVGFFSSLSPLPLSYLTQPQTLVIPTCFSVFLSAVLRLLHTTFFLIFLKQYISLINFQLKPLCLMNHRILSLLCLSTLVFYF